MMENQNETLFTRRKRVGMSILDIPKIGPKGEEAKSVFIEVKDFFMFTSEKYPEEIPAFKVTNLETGETDQTMWIDGGLKGQFHSMGGIKSAVGLELEIKHIGYSELEVKDPEGKTIKTDVNRYDIFELDPTH